MLSAVRRSLGFFVKVSSFSQNLSFLGHESLPVRGHTSYTKYNISFVLLSSSKGIIYACERNDSL